MRETAARRAFATTLALSAALSFSVQPMAGRALLPTLGGSPAVWSTCLVFFQAALLAGYGWAHLLATRVTPRRGLLLHGVLLAAAIAWTGLGGDPAEANAAAVQSPIAWTLRALGTDWGPAFLALAATGPLVQHWYSRTGHNDAADPYFLYAASNVGSFLGLLGYPFVIEPLLGLQAQQLAWLGGLGIAVPAILGTGWYALRRGGSDGAATGDAAGPGDAASRPAAPTATRQLRWLLLALVPSSLLLGVTAFLTTDLAAAPMLWVVPLGLYLLTWIGAFARRPWLSPEATARALPIAVVAWLLLHLMEATEPAWALGLFHLGTFGLAALACHGRLAADRPAPAYLTRFYLLTSTGGVFGGALNALVAPAVLPDLWEYPAALVAALLLLPGVRRPQWTDLGAALGVGAAVLLLGAGADALGLPPGPVRTIAVFGLPVLAAYLLGRERVRFGLAVAALLLAAPLQPGVHGAVLHRDRSFFGVQRVTQSPDGRFHEVVHGHTLHGRQHLDPAQRCTPLAYYHPSGPLGDVVAAARGGAEGAQRPLRVAMVGLGAGAMLSYRQAGDRWRVVEIDAATFDISRRHFGFWSCPDAAGAAVPTEAVVADGRLDLAGAAGGPGGGGERFDLIALDVFSSDAVPVHLLTREAFAGYATRLQPGGVLAVHASNRYVDVVAIAAAAAGAAGLVAVARDDRRVGAEVPGVEPSRWIAIARRSEDLDALRGRRGWTTPTAADRAWTDDYNDLPLRVLTAIGGGGER
ncbi:MAG: hypothetical protein H6747_11325 [Deltaproteobacteria bacterium]|nr:hypothetical protein [Deltaproteobacteria bacterium]